MSMTDHSDDEFEHDNLVEKKVSIQQIPARNLNKSVKCIKFTPV
jgi:hypothetical protein